jgi:hypothetical protein
MIHRDKSGDKKRRTCFWVRAYWRGVIRLWWQAFKLAGFPLGVSCSLPLSNGEPSRIGTARVIPLEVARVHPVSSSEDRIKAGAFPMLSSRADF